MQKEKVLTFEYLLMERMMGIEPTRSAWKAEVLPLNYIRLFTTLSLYHAVIYMSRTFYYIGKGAHWAPTLMAELV